MLVNNHVLTRVFRISPLPDRKFGFALGMGTAVTLAIVLASLAAFPVCAHLPAPFEIAYLAAVVYILVAVALVRAAEMLIRRIMPALHRSLGIYLPLVTVNCAVLGAACIVVSPGPYDPNVSGLAAFVFRCFGAGAGFTMALVIMAGIRERFELADMPEYLKGAPVAVITAGLLALAFFGFSGMKI